MARTLWNTKDGVLEASDMFEAVAYWLYSHCGAVSLDVVVDVKTQENEDQAALKSEALVDSYVSSPSKRELEASPWVASGESTPIPSSPGPSPNLSLIHI